VHACIFNIPLHIYVHPFTQIYTIHELSAAVYLILLFLDPSLCVHLESFRCALVESLKWSQVVVSLTRSDTGTRNVNGIRSNANDDNLLISKTSVCGAEKAYKSTEQQRKE